MREIVKTNKAPGAIGPYNQATIANGVVYVSGQIALDPKTGELRNQTVEEETKQVLKNLKAVLKAAGSDLDHVLKSTIFMSDMNNYAAINDVYSKFFEPGTAPAREAVAVSALPKYVRVEISCIALVKQ